MFKLGAATLEVPAVGDLICSEDPDGLVELDTEFVVVGGVTDIMFAVLYLGFKMLLLAG